jgi:hypothetical protein
MNTDRNTAIAVGLLYILGTVAGVLSVLVTQPILGAADYLKQLMTNENQMLTGALLVLTMGLALVWVAVLLFPILRRYNEMLAVGYVVFRGALEMATYIAMVIGWMFLIAVSREYTTAGAANLPSLQTLGSILMQGSDSISNILIIIFSIDAFILYYVLYKSRLVPRWISIWGFIAILLHFSTAFLLMFGIAGSNVTDIFNLPIFLQEMAMAVWLIVKGFSPAVLASLSAKTAKNELLSEV